MLILNLVVLAGVALLVFVAPLALRILFSGRFVDAANITAILGVSIVSQVVGWCYAMFLLHRAEFATRLALEAVWGVARVAGTWYCNASGWPRASIDLHHIAAYSQIT